MSRGGWAALPRGAAGLSAVCDCGISRSYSLFLISPRVRTLYGNASLETHNRFDTLSSLSDPESLIPDIIPPPPPPPRQPPLILAQKPKEAKGKAAKAALNDPLRILIMNCQSIKNKQAELHTIIDYAKPDIILGNEFWLTTDIKPRLLWCSSERQSKWCTWWCLYCF